MADDKHKTKAAILNELESIKDLLVENGGTISDEIPLLNEVIDGDELDPPLLPLAEGDIPTVSDQVELAEFAEAESELEPPLLTDGDIHGGLTGSTEAELEPSLLAPSELNPSEPSPSDEELPPAAEDDSSTLEVRQADEAVLEDQTSLDNASLAPLPGQQSLFDEVPLEPEADGTPIIQPSAEAKTKLADTKPLTTRPKTAGKTGQPRARAPQPQKPLGENPFLPQHIRDRLQGNRPFTVPEEDAVKPERYSPSAPAKEPDMRHSDRRQQADEIVHEVIAEFMPKIEAELRRRLLAVLDTGDQEPKAAEQGKAPDQDNAVE